MSESRESRFKKTMDGSNRSMSAHAARAAASIAEPAYAALMRMRNGLYDAKILASHHLGRPTISVGNITTGGTGKTPVVQWLAKKLSESGHHPAVLIRGYKKTSHGQSDEQTLLAAAGIPVITNPDRHRGASAALTQYPQTTLFILDDAMQHRRVKRDFELALIHAAEPFGFNRIFPRGLLREPLRGLRRAHAFLITHADEVAPNAISAIKSKIAEHHNTAPIFQCDHHIQADLAGKKYFAFCGIGSPKSFFEKLQPLGGQCVGTRALDDHHDYSEPELIQIAQSAKSSSAELLVTTAKDWVKIEPIAANLALPIVKAELSLQFHSDDEEKLFAAIRQQLNI